MNDDTTGTASFESPDGEPTMVLPGADSSPTTVLRAPWAPGAATGTATMGAEGGALTAVLPDPRLTPYLDAAASHLADLPPGERAELLEDLAAHLAEIAADEGSAFAARLGSPEQYAAEFRASAGYPPAGSGAGAAAPGRLRTLAHDAAGAGRELGARTADGVRGFPGGPALMSLLPRLRPAWWVFRAWLAALVLGIDWPTGAYNGMGHLGAFFWQLLFVALSVAWGLRTERRGAGAPTAERLVLFVLNGIAVWICLLGVFGGGPLTDINNRASQTYSEADATAWPSGLSMSGRPITNLSAFDLEGRPIPGFQLFDQEGNPVVAATDAQYGPNGEVAYPLPATDSSGYPLNEAFPVTYVLATDYFDEATGNSALQVSRILAPQRVAPLTGITAPVVPPIGSIVPFNDNGEPDWAAAQAPGAAPARGPSPTPAPTDTSAGSRRALSQPHPDCWDV